MFLFIFSILVMKIFAVTSDNTTAPVRFVNCPEGASVNRKYILAGTSATCKCQRTNTSQNGRIVWYLNDGTTESRISEGDSGADNSIPRWQAERDESNKTVSYICCMEDGDVRSVCLQYRPNIAYGPNVGSLTMTPGDNSDWNFDLCPGENKQMIVFCEVPVSSVSPVPGLEFYYSRGGISDLYIDRSLNVTSIGNTYRFVRGFRPEISEPYYVTCKLSNSIFPHIDQAVNGTVVVREPPNTLPVMTVSNEGKTTILANGSTAFVTGNSHVIVKCSVRGGTPEVSSVTIVCDISRNTEIGTSATLGFDTTNSSPTSCACDASHVSGCYNYKMVVQIVPVYQPSILNFTANDHSDTLIVDSGSEVRLVCQALGSPVPSISFFRSDTRLPQVQEPGLELGASFTNVQCDFTSRYYCVARNGLETNINLPQKYVDVYVRCLITLKDPSKQDMKIKVKLGTNASVTVEVKGYPVPTSFVLTIPKSGYDLTVEQWKYTVSYQPETGGMPTPYGIITLHIINIQKDDLTTYRLMISNGGQLAFIFTLNEAAETNNTIYIATGVSVGVVFLIIGSIVLATIYCRRKRRNAYTDSSIYITTTSSLPSYYSSPGPACVEQNDYTEPWTGASLNDINSIASKDIYDTVVPASVSSEYQETPNIHKFQ